MDTEDTEGTEGTQGTQETFQDLYSEDDLKLGHIPDVAECRQLRRQFEREQFWPNVWHVNDHGNADLLSIGYNGVKIVQSFV